MSVTLEAKCEILHVFRTRINRSNYSAENISTNLPIRVHESDIQTTSLLNSIPNWHSRKDWYIFTLKKWSQISATCKFCFLSVVRTRTHMDRAESEIKQNSEGNYYSSSSLVKKPKNLL